MSAYHIMSSGKCIIATVEASSTVEALTKHLAHIWQISLLDMHTDEMVNGEAYAVWSYGEASELLKRWIVLVRCLDGESSTVAVKTEQGTVTVDILAAATVEAVAEQVATDAYTAGCDAKFFAKTHAARIAKAAGTALTTEVKHLITTVTRRTVDQLDSALMA